MQNAILDVLQEKVSDWRVNGYENIHKETRSILNHIKSVGFLYKPQIDALETYIYLKEVLNNQPTQNLLTTLYPSYEEILDTLPISDSEKYSIIRDADSESRIKELVLTDTADFDYANQVYALAMGSGKTILMGAMILYEFILSTTHPEDRRFAKNILVFAPDTTIIESLKEIKTFDYSRVVPNEYQNVLLNIKYHYLESPETAVNFIGNYNVVVSNSQKIILKTKNLHGQHFLLNEKDRQKQYYSNHRREAIRQLENLSIFVDEAHHSYGSDLEGKLKKIRKTIDYLHKEGKTPLVNVVNLTGTPYVKNKLIPDVVYHFGLKQGIEMGILKQVKFFEYGNVKSSEFIETVVDSFVESYQNRLEDKLPKIAFYAANIDDLRENLKPQLEKVLLDRGITTDRVLEYHTEAEQNKDEFLRLDTSDSDKQFILLVGKGTEGWNVRSLVATALYRKPKSAIFVLQSSTRCLRRIGDNSAHATIFLSSENAKILDNELESNFSISRADLEGQKRENIELTLSLQKKKRLTVKKEVRTIESVSAKDYSEVKLPSLQEKDITIPDTYVVKREITLDADENEAIYEKKGTELLESTNKFLTRYELIAKLNRKTHLPNATINNILKTNKIEGTGLSGSQIYLEYVTDLIAQSISEQIFDYKENVEIIDEEIELTKNFPFNITKDPNKQGLIVYKQDVDENRLGFHINPYSFDSEDEKDLFLYLCDVLEPNEVIEDVYFTGNINDSSHTDFFFEYWNPTHKRVARYFPDFLVETNTGRYVVVEVKGDNERTTYEENKKQYKDDKKNIFDDVFAKEVGFRDFQRFNKEFDYHIIFNARLQQKQQELLEKINNYVT